MKPSRTAILVAKEEDAHGRSRPKAGTDRGLPPNVSYECWPSASDPQSTSTPAANDGISEAAPPFQAMRLAEPPRDRPVRSTCRWISAKEIVCFRPNRMVRVQVRQRSEPTAIRRRSPRFSAQSFDANREVRKPVCGHLQLKPASFCPGGHHPGPCSGQTLLRLAGYLASCFGEVTPKWYYMEVAAWSYHSRQAPNEACPNLSVFKLCRFRFPFSPHIPSNLLLAPWHVAKVRAPNFFLRPDFLYGKRHKSPRLTKTQMNLVKISPRNLGFLAHSFEHSPIPAPARSTGSDRPLLDLRVRLQRSRPLPRELQAPTPRARKLYIVFGGHARPTRILAPGPLVFWHRDHSNPSRLYPLSLWKPGRQIQVPPTRSEVFSGGVTRRTRAGRPVHALSEEQRSTLGFARPLAWDRFQQDTSQ
jgi:hypothetical protein